MNYKIIIPARKGSKGVTFKNRKLLINTLSIIPKEKYSDTIITTDDPVIEQIIKEYSMIFHQRKPELSIDQKPPKETPGEGKETWKNEKKT